MWGAMLHFTDPVIEYCMLSVFLQRLPSFRLVQSKKTNKQKKKKRKKEKEKKKKEGTQVIKTHTCIYRRRILREIIKFILCRYVKYLYGTCISY